MSLSTTLPNAGPASSPSIELPTAALVRWTRIAVLVAFFVALVLVLAQRGGKFAAADAIVGALQVWVAAVMLALWSQTARSLRLERIARAEAERLMHGEYEGVEARLTELLDHTVALPRTRARIVYCLGMARLRTSEVEDALECFDEIASSGLFESGRRDRRFLLGELALHRALCLAILGHVEEARRVVEASSRELGRSANFHEFVATYLRIRGGDTEAWIEPDWSRTTTWLWSSNLRALHALCAFEKTRRSLPVSSQELALAFAPPAGSADFAYVARGWPEFQGFVDSMLPCGAPAPR